MSAATESDFLGGGGVIDPFTGLAPDATEEQRLAARRERLRQSATGTANINAKATPRGSSSSGYFGGIDESGKEYTGKPDPGSFGSTILPTLKAISRDPVTMGILMAPYGVLATGAAAGGLSSGGAGSIVGDSAPGMAFKDTVLPSITRTPIVGPPGGAVATGGAPAAAATGATTGATTAAAAVPAAADAWTWKDTVHTAIPAIGAAVDIAAQLGINAGRDKERKALIEKQEQMAREVKLRQQYAAQTRMDALAQQVMAFNPRNQMLAQMFGPGAAFTPEQMAAMVANPAKPTISDPSLLNYSGTDQKKLQELRDYNRREREYAEAEERRKQMVMSGITPPGPAQAPMKLPTPLAAKRY